MALFDTTSFRIAEQGLNLLTKQQAIIAQNIANVDTPDYKCKYLYFAGVLKEKLDESGRSTGKPSGTLIIVMWRIPKEHTIRICPCPVWINPKN